MASACGGAKLSGAALGHAAFVVNMGRNEEQRRRPLVAHSSVVEGKPPLGAERA